MRRAADRKIVTSLLGAAAVALLLGPAAQAASAPTVSALKVSPSRFAAGTGTKVSYRLDRAATVEFSIRRRLSGRRVTRGGVTSCVVRTRANAKNKRCVLAVTLPGTFSRRGASGANSFRFTGRLRGVRLKPGGYDLVATAIARGKTGRLTSAPFRIRR